MVLLAVTSSRFPNGGEIYQTAPYWELTAPYWEIVLLAVASFRFTNGGEIYQRRAWPTEAALRW